MGAGGVGDDKGPGYQPVFAGGALVSICSPPVLHSFFPIRFNLMHSHLFDSSVWGYIVVHMLMLGWMCRGVASHFIRPFVSLVGAQLRARLPTPAPGGTREQGWWRAWAKGLGVGAAGREINPW